MCSAKPSIQAPADIDPAAQDAGVAARDVEEDGVESSEFEILGLAIGSPIAHRILCAHRRRRGVARFSRKIGRSVFSVNDRWRSVRTAVLPSDCASMRGLTPWARHRHRAPARPGCGPSSNWGASRRGGDLGHTRVPLRDPLVERQMRRRGKKSIGSPGIGSGVSRGGDGRLGHLDSRQLARIDQSRRARLFHSHSLRVSFSRRSESFATPIDQEFGNRELQDRLAGAMAISSARSCSSLSRLQRGAGSRWRCRSCVLAQPARRFR